MSSASISATAGKLRKLMPARKQSTPTLLDAAPRTEPSSNDAAPPTLESLPFQSSGPDFKPKKISLHQIRLLSDLVILVMGATGGGKSTIINSLVGEPVVPINETMEPSTEFSVVRISTPKGNVCFIEVPELKEPQFQALYQRYNVIGIIFIHKVIDNRLSGELLRDMEDIKRACKEDPTLASHVVCITSHWYSDLYDDPQELLIEEELMNTVDGWKKEREKEEGLEFRRFVLRKPWEIREVLDHLLKRSGVTFSSSVKCDEEDVWTAQDWKIVVVMGLTGAGKSNFVEKACNQSYSDIDDKCLLESATQQIQAYKVHINGHKLILVDTPGFDDTNRSDYEILKMIASWLERTFRHQVLVSGVLYFHRITDNRMSGSALANIQVFQGLMGKGMVSQNVKFVTTMWDQDAKGLGESREKELRGKYWDHMVKDGASVVRFHNTHESAKEVLKSFRTDWHMQQALQLQVEMVKQHQRLKETKAGQQMYSKLDHLLSEHNALLAKKRKDPNFNLSTDPEYLELMKILAEVERDMKELHLGIGNRLRGLFSKMILN